MELWSSYCLYKHLTSIKKRQEETTAHTQNRTPEKNEQEGGSRAPENTNREDRRGKTRVEKGEKRQYSISGEVQETCRGHAGPSSAADVC